MISILINEHSRLTEELKKRMPHKIDVEEISCAGVLRQETSKCLIILEKYSHQKLSQIWGIFGTEKYMATVSAIGTVKGNARVAF